MEVRNVRNVIMVPYSSSVGLCRMSLGGYPTPQDWLRGWREWARTRKRGRMAQFIVDKLEEGVSP